MSDPVTHLKRELLAAAERQQRHTVLAPKSRRRWLERFRFVPRRRRRLVVVLAALVLATAATTAGWAIVNEVVLHKGFVGLPPVGATPSAPESGELVIQYWFDTEDIEPADGGRGWVYADGRLLTADARPITLRSHSDRPEAATRWSSGLLEQRLTPEGVELLRSEIVSTGLFEHHEPAGRSSSPHNVIQVRIGDRLVRAQAKGAAASDEFPKRLREAARGSGIVAAGRRVGGPSDQAVRALQVRRLLRRPNPDDRAVPPLASATCSRRVLARLQGGGAPARFHR